MKRCILFDLDGLLFDSEMPTLIGLQYALSERGITFTKEDYERCVGLAIDDMADFFHKEYQVSNARQMLLDVFNTIRFRNQQCPPLKAGAAELLKTARERQITLGIGTSSERQVAIRFTHEAKIEHYFSAIVGGDDVERRKPHPDIYLKALELLSMKPDDAVVLEDSHHGVLAGHAAGIRVICIPDLFPATPEVSRIAYAEYASLSVIAQDIDAILAE